MEKRLKEELQNDLASVMVELYSTKYTWYDCVHEITEVLKMDVTKQEAELMWRAIDSYSDSIDV